LAVLLFASWLHLLPATGYAPLSDVGVLGWAAHLVLPVLVLTCASSRMSRASPGRR